MSRTGRAAVGLAVAAAAWIVLAGLRPDSTFHLAPAVVAWAYPYLRLGGERSSYREAVGAMLIGAITASVVAGLLAVVGWLEGPVLFGGNALGEALLVVVAASVVGLGIGLGRAASR